jgi:hypothetical protein
MNSKFNPFILVTRKTRPRKIERRERERESIFCIKIQPIQLSCIIILADFLVDMTINCRDRF